MITLNMMLLPGGSGIGRSEILSGTIWTTTDGKYHAYDLTVNDHNRIAGKVEKTQSGHKNPWHLLRAIADQVLEDQNVHTKAGEV